MDSTFVIIPRMQVQNANMISSYWLLNGAAVNASVMFAHAIGRELDNVDEIDGVALIHHDAELQAESGDYARVLPFQRRGASLIDKNDYSKNTLSLSLQPTATRHLKVSLIIRFSGDAIIDDEAIDEFLQGARFAGGSVLTHQDIVIAATYEELSKQVKNGYYVVERQDLIGDEDPLETVLDVHDHRSDFYTNSFSDFLSNIENSEFEKKEKELYGKMQKLLIQCIKDNISITSSLRKLIDIYRQEKIPLITKCQEWQNNHTWLAATNLGYKLQTTPEQKAFVRENYPHAYAEPLIGLVQYKSARSLSISEIKTLFWHHEWANSSTFIINQSRSNT